MKKINAIWLAAMITVSCSDDDNNSARPPSQTREPEVQTAAPETDSERETTEAGEPEAEPSEPVPAPGTGTEPPNSPSDGETEEAVPLTPDTGTGAEDGAESADESTDAEAGDAQDAVEESARVVPGFYPPEDVNQLIRQALIDFTIDHAMENIRQALDIDARIVNVEVDLDVISQESFPDGLTEDQSWDDLSSQHLMEFMESEDFAVEISGVTPVPGRSGINRVSRGTANIILRFPNEDSVLTVRNLPYQLRDASNILIAHSGIVDFPAAFQSVIVEFSGNAEPQYDFNGVMVSVPDIVWRDAAFNKAAIFVDTSGAVNLNPGIQRIQSVSAYDPTEAPATKLSERLKLRLESMVSPYEDRELIVYRELKRLHELYVDTRDAYLDGIDDVVARHLTQVEDSIARRFREVEDARSQAYDQIVSRAAERAEQAGRELSARWMELEGESAEITEQRLQERNALAARLKEEAIAEVQREDQIYDELRSQVESQAENERKKWHDVLVQSKELSPYQAARSDQSNIITESTR